MADDQGAARTAIAATNRKFESAFNAGDPAGAARAVYSAEARVLPPDMPMVTGREAIAAFWTAAAAQMQATSVQLSTLALDVHGDHAHEIGTAVLTLAGAQQMQAKFVVLWKQEGGEWRWDVDIWNGGV